MSVLPQENNSLVPANDQDYNAPIIAFDFFGQILQAMSIDGEPWFVARDVAQLLGYVDTDYAIRAHCKASRAWSGESSGQLRRFKIISERDLYRLVMRSKLPSAQRFEDWVVGDVLPQIRKTGGYVMPKNYKESIVHLLAQIEATERAEALASERAILIEQQAPKVEFAEVLMNAEGTTLVRDVAKIIGVPVKKFYAALKLKRVLLQNQAPAAKYVERGYFKEGTKAYETLTRGTQIGHTARVTGTGIEFLRRFAKKHADLLQPTQRPQKSKAGK